jgi:hypothetical protein
LETKARVGLVLAALATLCAARPPDRSITYRHSKVTVHYVGTVPKPNDLMAIIPEDVDAQGQLLLLAVPVSLQDDKPLLLFDTRNNKFLLPRVTVRWPELVGASVNHNCVPPALRFLDLTGHRAAGLYGCFIVVVNLRKPAIQWFARIPEIPHKYSVRDSARLFATALLAINRRQQKFAVIVDNEVMKKPEVFLYDARSSSPLLSWRLPRFVQSAVWSPDGKKLTVLYSASGDANLNYYDVDVKRKLLTLPDVAVFDARTGHLDFSFFSGQPEAQIRYSPDGKLLHCIVDSGALPMTFFPHHGRDAIRVFSAADGRLVRTIRVPGTGVRSRFALSPDGKLIAADATTNATWVPHDPPPIAVRFVLLDVATGKKLFEHEETWGGGDATATTLMFSPDGRFLITDPLAADGEGPVEIYRLVGAR